MHWDNASFSILNFSFSGGVMLRIEAIQAIYDRLERCVVVTI